MIVVLFFLILNVPLFAQEYEYVYEDDYEYTEYSETDGGESNETTESEYTFEPVPVVAITNEVFITNIITIPIPSVAPIFPDVCLAILRTNLNDVQWYISQIPELLTARRGDGESLLHLAIARSDYKISKYLIDSGADVNAQNTNGRTPLHIAVQQNKLSIVDALIKAGASVRIQDQFGYSPLWVANTKGYIHILDLLVKAQQQQPISAEQIKALSPKRSSNVTSLEIPTHFDTYQDFTRKLVEHKVLMDTPWHNAIYTTGYEDVKKLISLGMDPNIRDSYGRTPLHLAALYNNIEALMFLSSLPSIIIHAEDNFGSTPLHIAAGKASPQIIKLLINNGCNVSQKNKAGWTPLFEAVLLGNHPVVRFLLEQGISPNTTTHKGRTPLHEASRMGYDYIVRDLLTAGSSVNSIDYRGKTPFYLATENGHIGALAQLYEKGADTTLGDIQKQSPLHIAILNNHFDVVRYLLEVAKVPIGVVDYLGRTPLDLAYLRGSGEMISLLAEEFLVQQTELEEQRTTTDEGEATTAESYEEDIYAE